MLDNEECLAFLHLPDLTWLRKPWLLEILFFPTFSSLFKHKLTLGGGSVLWLHKSVDQLHAQWQQCLLSTSYVSGSRELFYFEEITL